MGIVYNGLPETLTLFLQRRFGLRSLIETGTYVGNTAVWASQYFEKVYSIEKSEEYWLKAKDGHAARTNIEFLLGASPEVLARLVGRVDRPLFWLDAHWSGGDTAGSDNECPLLDEIAVIAESTLEPKVILIDDARMFLAPPPAPHRWSDWPDLGDVVRALEKCGDMYVAVKDDAIIAIPAAGRADLTAFWREQP
ncbi:MAG: hypothetical protein HQL37_08610 [Alphaproteobacteria bacterium]|nr:hypothetical protein [Alphaproteobacteria bacterium]